ncbi:myelin-oligodendrocyte glycoprotein-like [Spea bombifrons]|uniref:myelin-oligodendrocyte glycoprotein-like n=1 Tax=Spea bombifrons TaxID=233779 RepID=UPI00234A0B40|nr:myelin-oligodendrocyte glycoprotein-like [Spea bombifrons]
MSVSEMNMFSWIHGIALSLFLLSWAPCEGSVPTVTAVLHGTAVLPCSVPFISGTEDLLVSWVKKIGTKPSLVLLAFNKGQFDLTHQPPQYRGRTNMTPDLSNGRLDLTLTHVEHRDEGVYVCQVMNKADYRDIEVRLRVIESGTSGGDQSRPVLWVTVLLLFTAGVFRGCYSFCRRRSPGPRGIHRHTRIAAAPSGSPQERRPKYKDIAGLGGLSVASDCLGRAGRCVLIYDLFIT